jgi:hypothetical protein
MAQHSAAYPLTGPAVAVGAREQPVLVKSEAIAVTHDGLAVLLKQVHRRGSIDSESMLRCRVASLDAQGQALVARAIAARGVAVPLQGEASGTWTAL